jgi:hypothetical protein
MSFSDFTLPQVARTFRLVLEESAQVFVSLPEAPVGSLLTATLAENLPLALAIHTEKARSELLIAPMLVELRRLLEHRISLFSGIAFDVDSEQGLSGTCDYLLSRSPEQLYMRAPVAAIVEAKNDNLKAGLGQCIAEMVAARLFNEREGNCIDAVYGMVTTGSLWKPLELRGQTVTIDPGEYHISQAGRVLGILRHMAEGRTAPAG